MRIIDYRFDAREDDRLDAARPGREVDQEAPDYFRFGLRFGGRDGGAAGAVGSGAFGGVGGGSGGCE